MRSFGAATAARMAPPSIAPQSIAPALPPRPQRKTPGRGGCLTVGHRRRPHTFGQVGQVGQVGQIGQVGQVNQVGQVGKLGHLGHLGQ